MTTLAQGASVNLTLANNGFLEVATNGGFGSVTITPTRGAAVTESWGPSPFRKRWNGPYPEGATVALSNGTSAEFDYETDSSNLPASVQALVSADWIPQAVTVLPDEVVRMAASGGVCGAPCYVSRIRCVTGTSVALTVYEGAASTTTTLLTATLSAGEEATIPNNKLRAINGVRAVFASGSFDFYIGTE